MRKLFLAYLIINSAYYASAQNPVPNPGFETAWSNGKPNNWSDSRDIYQVSPGHSGSYAAKGEKTNLTTYPAFISSAGGAGIPVSMGYAYLNLFYKFNSVASDVMFISAIIRNSAQVQIGSGVMPITVAQASFTPLSIYISSSGGIPHDAVISVILNSSLGGNPTVGTYFIIDDLSLTGSPLAIENVERQFSAFQVFPNPARNFIKVQFDEFKTMPGKIEISDLMGRIVKEASLGSGFELSLDISDLPRGNYLLAIRNDEMIRTKILAIE